MLKKIFNIVLIGAIVAVIGYCTFQIATTMQERYLAKSEYEGIRDSYVSAIQPAEETTVEETAPTETKKEDDGFPDRSIDTVKLLKDNSDYIGWIYYKDGGVDLPIVQESSANVNYYLDHTFNNNQNPAGCLFMPMEGDPTFRSLNNFIYGHNMKDNTMLGGLKLVYQKPKEATDPYFYIWDSLHTVTKYRVFAVYLVDENSNMYSIPGSSEDYNKYINRALQKGSIDGYIKFTDKEKEALEKDSPIVTLSTCYGSAGTSQRLLVQGVKIASKSFE